MRAPRNQQFVLLGIVAALIIIAHYAGALIWVERAVVRLVNPPARALFQVGARLTQIYYDANDQRDIQALYDALEARNHELLAENINLRLLAEENEALREQLQFSLRTTYTHRLANVLRRTSDADSRRIITLDIGSADGVSVGSAVVAGDGLLVGKVAQVEGHLAQVCLLTDNTCHVAAGVVGTDKPGGITQGELGLTVRMDFVPQEETLAIGDTIVTSGLELGVPAGLVIGSIQEVRNEAGNLFQTAIITPAIDTRALRVVSVIIP